MAQTAKKDRGKYNRRHEHGERSQQNNATPDNDQAGQGPNADRGNGPAGAQSVDGIEEIIARAIRGGAKVAYGEQLRQNREEGQQLVGQGREIDRAYDAYANQIGKMQSASAQRAQGLIDQTQESAAALQGVGQAVTAEGAAGAQDRAATLGFGTTESDAYTGLGSSAGLSREAAAKSLVDKQANIGVSNIVELAGRAASGRRDQIRSREDLQQLQQGNMEERGQILREKGGWMAQKLYEYLQQQEENKIAQEGIELQAKNARADRKDTRHDNQLADETLAANIADDLADNAQAAQNAADDRHGSSGTSSDGSGLSVNEQETYQTKIDTIKAFREAYEAAMKSGATSSQATRRAARKAGVQSETWIINIGRQLAKHGKLNDAATQALLGNLPPGSEIPERWR